MTRSQAHPATGGGLPAIHPPTVLVVDDDETLRTVLARELRRRGFDVYSTGSGAEAVEMYCRTSTRFDVVLMDLNMPVMNGSDALAAIRAVDPLVRCCFMTADARPETRSTLRQAGGREVLTKPFASMAEVCEALRRFADVPHGGWKESGGGEYAGSDSARRLHEEGE